MNTIKVIHISDLHISEELMREVDSKFHLPHRYGHDIQTFLALDHFLNSEQWDILVISGDISRIGNEQSFIWARNWIEGKINIDNFEIGLNIKQEENKHYVIVPGNHDRFNGGTTQSSLEKYSMQFQEVINAGKVITREINGVKINFHLFDSSTGDGSFAYGKIEDSSLVPRKINQDSIDFGVLHHHFIQPPNHKRETSTELVNSSHVASYMLSQGFNALLFGHTHKSYIGHPSVKMLSCLLNDKRKKGGFFKKKLPNWFLRNRSNDGLVSYKREKAINGQYPTLAYYFEYRYLLQNKHNVVGPPEFNTIQEFYEHIDQFKSKNNLKKELDAIAKEKVLVSLAPSACQAEAKWNGLHKISFKIDKERKISTEWDRFQYKKGAFSKVDRKEHRS